MAAPKFTVKVHIAVYENTDDMADVFSVDLKATTNNQNSALGFAQEIQESAQAELLKMKRD